MNSTKSGTRAIRILCCVAASLVVACEPAERTVAPPAETASVPRPPDAPDPDRLRSAIESAEHFVRLETAFSAVRQIEDGRQRALAAWRAQHGRDPDKIELIGTRSGFPAFAVAPALGAPRQVLLATDDEVLSSPADFARFVQRSDVRGEATRCAAAWLLLRKGVAREPLGPSSEPPALPPRWVGELLILSYVADDGRPRQVTLRLGEDGSADEVPSRP